MARSRLTKHQQRKLVKQTFLIALAAIIILVSFVVFIVPGLVQLAGNALNESGVTENQDQVPPQTPILSAPPAATNSAKLSINGFGEAGAEAVLILDLEEVGRTEINEEGQFEFDLPLNEGENELVVYSIDQAENESRQTRNYLITLDTEAPSIELEQPQDGESFELRKNQLIEIKGKTEPNSRVFINERLVYANDEGSFSTRFQLSEGENKIKFRVIDQAGNVSEKEMTVNFRF